MTKSSAAPWLKFITSPNVGRGKNDPRVIVMHYTATWTGKAAIRTLTDPAANVSAHFVVDRDGTITQLVDTDKVAWHAGPSKWGKYEGLNDNSIGIELVNIGYVRALADGNYIDPYGKVMKGAEVEKMGLIGFQDERLGPGAFYQPLYPEAQLASLDKLVAHLLKLHPTIEGITTHREVDTRKWKVDPGPAFPMARYTRLLPDRASPPKTDNSVYRTVLAEKLNVRDKPNGKLLPWGPLPRHAVVKVLKTQDGWSQIYTAGPGVGVTGKSGWVKAEFLGPDTKV